MEKKNKELVIFSMLSGLQISSWRESRKMETGHFSAQTKLQAFMSATEPLLKNFIFNTKLKEEETKLSKLKNFGN